MSPSGQVLLYATALPAVLLTAAAGLVWVERRLLGLWQDRYGPNRVGPFGILQPLADGLKLLFKQDWTPPEADGPAFVLAPAIVVVTTLLAFAVVPAAPGLGVASGLDTGLLLVLAATALGAYSLVLAGWASSNKYSLLGGLRAAAQLLSYEVFLGLSLLGVVVLAGSFELEAIVRSQADLWYVVPQAPAFFVFLVAGLAETHRLPFDIPESETELVAGYHTEYSGLKFGMFFLGEYLGMLLIAALVTVLFLGGWHGPWLPPVVWFGLKTALGVAFFVLMRASLPRPRYDQLMALGWKVLLPLTLLNLMATGAVVLAA